MHWISRRGDKKEAGTEERVWTWQNSINILKYSQGINCGTCTCVIPVSSLQKLLSVGFSLG